MTKYKPFETVTWYAVDGHQYTGEADDKGNLYSFRGRHTTDCQCWTNEEWYEDGLI